MPWKPKPHQPAQLHIETRPSASERGYDWRWQKARIAFLAWNPLCKQCEKEGKVSPATIVDHVKPHRGDYDLFWDQTNWQSLCKPCHDAKTGQGQ